MTKRWASVLACAFLYAGAVGPAMADEVEELRSLRDTTIELLNLLVKQGVLTREKADELIRQAEQAGHKPASGAVAGSPAPSTGGAASASAASPTTAGAAGGQTSPPGSTATASAADESGVIRVPYVPETVKQQIRDEVKQEVLSQARQERWGEPGALPRWLDRFSFNGDIRFRGQGDRFPKDSQPNALPQQFQLPAFGGFNINNTSDARNRLRLRVRFGTDIQVADTVTAGIRLTSGTSGTGGDPSSENENLGNYNARGSVGFDRGFVTYRPWPWLYITGGRLGNPFFSPTTLVWADDLSLQGLVAGANPTFGPFTPFATLGIFPIQDVEPTPLTSSKSKWLYGYQSGLKWQATEGFSAKLAVALYDYRHLEGIPNPDQFTTEFSGTAAPFRQKGNSVFDINEALNVANGTSNYLIGLASRFREANASLSLDLRTFGTKHLVLDADWVRNIGFHHDEILARTGLDLTGRTNGDQVRLSFGDVSFASRNSWIGYVGYRRVQRDAVVDGFTDSDFHLGGTDATGYYLGGRYAFARNTTIGARWFSAKQIDSLPLAIDVLQIDLIAAF